MKTAAPIASLGVLPTTRSLAELATLITRRRKGGKAEAAKSLRAASQRFANTRWAHRTKGQRRPTGRQAVALMQQIESAVVQSQVRASARTVSASDVIAAVVDADRFGRGYRDGGTVTASSYGYRWYTTTVHAKRCADGTITVSVSRSTARTITAPARHIAPSARDGCSPVRSSPSRTATTASTTVRMGNSPACLSRCHRCCGRALVRGSTAPRSRPVGQRLRARPPWWPRNKRRPSRAPVSEPGSSGGPSFSPGSRARQS